MPQDSSESCEQGPDGLGMMVGAFRKGEIAEMEVPLGPQRRFDLVALPKSFFPNSECKGILGAKLIAGENPNEHNVQLELNGAAFLTKAQQKQMRLIASAKADVVPGIVEVQLEALSINPSGVEYHCPNGNEANGPGSENGSGTTSPNPGGGSDNPLPRVGEYLDIRYPTSNTNTPPIVPSSITIGGACSSIGSPVLLTGAVTGAPSTPCELDPTPRLDVDGRYFTEGRWNADNVELLGADGPLEISASQNNNSVSATTTVNKDSTPPPISAVVTKHSTYVQFAITCEENRPIEVVSCTGTTNFDCTVIMGNLPTGGLPCLSGGSLNFSPSGNYSSQGRLIFRQTDAVGNEGSYTADF